VLAKVTSCAVIGLDGELVEVEVDISSGLPASKLDGKVFPLVRARRNDARDRPLDRQVAVVFHPDAPDQGLDLSPPHGRLALRLQHLVHPVKPMEGVGGDEIKQRNVIADGAEQLLGPAHEVGMVWLVVTMR
jgi:hypothetical protein